MAVLMNDSRERKYSMNFEQLSTEQVNQTSLNLDAMTPLQAASLMNDIDNQASMAVKAVLPQIAKAVEVISSRLRAGGRLFYAGAGTSGRLGVLDASECPPTFGVEPGLVVGVIAGGDTALRFSIEGAEDSPGLGHEDMKFRGLCDKDVLVAISSSGYAPYCVGALDYALEVGAYAIALCCNTDSVLSKHADFAIELPTGPEILSGSTRLKAGTATKMVLNMLSTLSMVQLGKVYKNLMVDMKPSNNKLSDRAVRIVKYALDLNDRAEAEALLQKANGNTKAAIVMALSNADYPSALKALEGQNGFVRRAVKQLADR
jgi:N-acetylmuramic acid 6-phosphate etherase